MKSKKLTKKEQKDEIISFMKKAIIFSFTFIVAYTIWTQIAISIGITLNDTITQCVFAFFGTEIIIMCAKKMFNMYLDNKKVKEEQIDEID